MPTYPTPEGRRCITLELPIELLQYVDAQAGYYGCSRAAYLRQLIVRDQERVRTAAA
jgi:hypothetical protein